MKGFLKSLQPGDKVLYVVDEFEGHSEDVAEVKEVFEDHIIISVPWISDHIWIDDGVSDMVRKI